MITPSDNSNLHRARQALRIYALDAYLLPSADPHQSEYVAEYWKGREWLSGFTGSAGTLVIMPDYAGLWTDSRYFLQAENQLFGSGIVLHRQQATGTPDYLPWLAEHLPPGSTLGLDGTLFSVGQLRQLEKALKIKDIYIKTDVDLLATIWHHRPALPSDPVFEYPIEYAGESRADKLQRIRDKMASQLVDFQLITTLDDIAWTLNLRGNDVAYNPIFISYLVIGKNVAYLFIDDKKISDSIKILLHQDGILLKPYTTITSFLQQLSAPILIDDRTINVQLYQSIPSHHLVKGENSTLAFKAIKNATQIGHLREAMRKDGVALTRFFRWLEQELPRRPVSEYEAARKLDECRREQDHYFGESFAAIVGYNAQGAIVHYRPEEAASAEITPKGILLVDSGGQYFEGTTDITRTVALGTPTDEQKRHFTLVLKGHIALAKAKFPVGTTGVQLDALARQFLWQEGLNFGHGTGHGVGFFLGVHEPPQGFTASANNQRATTPLEPGMLTSNEPGFYKTGAYGIRIENLLLCVPAEATESGSFLQFETVSLFPIDTHLIDYQLLNKAEIDWLHEYHEQVLAALTPRLDAAEVSWLRTKCVPILS